MAKEITTANFETEKEKRRSIRGCIPREQCRTG